MGFAISGKPLGFFFTKWKRAQIQVRQGPEPLPGEAAQQAGFQLASSHMIS